MRKETLIGTGVAILEIIIFVVALPKSDITRKNVHQLLAINRYSKSNSTLGNNAGKVPDDKVLYGTSGSSSSESESEESHAIQLVAEASVEDPSRKDALFMSSSLRMEDQYVHLPASKVFEFTYVLINVSVIACPEVGRPLLDSMNHFIAATLATEERSKKAFTSLEQEVYTENLRKLMYCVNVLALPKSPKDYVWDFDSANLPKIPRRKTRSVTAEAFFGSVRTGMSKRSSDLLTHAKMLFNFLQNLISTMRVACIHHPRPSHTFLDHLLYDVSLRLFNLANMPYMETALKKYSKWTQVTFKELRHCQAKMRKGSWFTGHLQDDDVY